MPVKLKLAAVWLVGLEGLAVIKVSGRAPMVYVYELSGVTERLLAASQAATFKTVVLVKVKAEVYWEEEIIGAEPSVVYLMVTPDSVSEQVTITELG